MSNPYTPRSGPSALLAGAPYTRISLWRLERVKPIVSLLGLVHQLYWLGFRTLEFCCEGSSVSNPYTPGSGPSALLAGVPHIRISL